MTTRLQVIAAIAMCFALSRGTDAFAPASSARVQSMYSRPQSIHLRMSETEESTSSPVASVEEAMEEIDPATKLALEKQKKADELRAQEVFMKRSTGVHKCSNCDWEYSPEKGDSFLIGGMIKPGTEFEELPSNWRCPTCRASKDNFNEVVETIPGFEVNQGYGFGTNSMTSGQKNSLIWGSIGAFFLLFIGGYALS
mmetsp:Transcript_17171/g.26964  ORF Transcript_17171/g.26964 Transcript_17171/m.26964 type:complete len:197 (-) Transcript_17171:244-834(-)|eukprot:CAMPEP_0201599766 /NCGR_PEP_ID=MMETSP0492-20130828/1093_1 /ASSEMBLY_ACC=CAM_ASM_000837 /TAXON_ID=420259 /ORGANISM="Thalassiosira gravida, Strain GMp14c1" /LENGTH=196 /DNA_ID=CAMNT_0048062403 /DNA_START=72 /DNA_END=662 /DNA_ORIENTATION=-